MTMPFNFDNYKRQIVTYDIHPKDELLHLLFMGLVLEANELDETLELGGSPVSEMGDVLWFVARIAHEFDLTLSQIVDAAGIIPPTIALAGVALSLLEKWYKASRDETVLYPYTITVALSQLVSSLLYYAEINALTLQDVAQRNILKLEDRYQRGVTKGSGNER